MGIKLLSLILGEGYGLKILENSDADENFWTKKDEIICDWRKLHNVELDNLHS
jgi:hypothetical protein